MTNANNISVLELKRLLIQINDNRPDVCIRIRIIGKMWWKSFARIVLIKENEALFNDESNGKLLLVSALSEIIQFEIDHAFQNFEPHFHYTVTPSLQE